MDDMYVSCIQQLVWGECLLGMCLLDRDHASMQNFVFLVQILTAGVHADQIPAGTIQPITFWPG